MTNTNVVVNYPTIEADSSKILLYTLFPNYQQTFVFVGELIKKFGGEILFESPCTFKLQTHKKGDS